MNDPLYNHTVFGPNKGKGGVVAKTDEQLIQDLIKIHNAENWLGMDGDAEYSMFKGRDKTDNEDEGELLHFIEMRLLVVLYKEMFDSFVSIR